MEVLENNLGQNENADKEYFLLFLQCFNVFYPLKKNGIFHVLTDNEFLSAVALSFSKELKLHGDGGGSGGGSPPLYLFQ